MTFFISPKEQLIAYSKIYKHVSSEVLTPHGCLFSTTTSNIYKQIK